MKFRFFKKLAIITVVFLFATFGSYAQNNTPDPALACGNEVISIASMQWPSAAILANIHAQILEKEYSCQTQIVAGDLNTTISSMTTTSEPLVAPEVWISRVFEIWNSAIQSDQIRQAGSSFSGSALEAWFIPDFIAKSHPELKSVSQLKDYWGVFKGEAEKARFISCPKDWACSIINRNMLKAYGVYDKFEIIEPKNRFEMDQLIGEAVSKNEPALFYYWQPNAILTQFNFLQLDMGKYEEEAFSCLAKIKCNNLEPSSFAPEPVVSVLATKLFQDAPKIARYFQTAKMPIKAMNETLAWQSENSKTASETASWFVEQKQEIWQNWVIN